MNDKTEHPPDEQPGQANEITTAEMLSAEHGRPTRSHARTVALIAVVALVAIAATVGLLLWNRNKAGAGRPVPAPTTLTAGQSTTAPQPEPTESTVTLSSQAAQNADIKLETVGEQLVATGASSGALATGTVQANTYRTTPVVSLVGGIVRQVNAELGQYVRQGQVMAVVFSDELAMSQSKYLTALADLEEHHQHHSRTLKLVEIGAASREEVEQATTKLRTAEAEVASQRERLLLLGLSPQRVNQLKSPSQVTSEVSLPAPVSGVVISRSANPGEVIQADKEILRVADLSSVWVIGQVYEKDLGSVRVGSGASVSSQAYPGRVFRGRVSYVDPTLDMATRTAQVRIELANPGQVLKIGMYVDVAFGATGAEENTGPTIPAAAVQNLDNRQVVFVGTNDPNIFVMRPVRLGSETNGSYQVLEGLHAGDRIVTQGSFLLRAEWLKMNPAR